MDERLPLPWRFEERNVPLADTGDYEGVIEIRAANNNVVAEAWNPNGEQEAAFRQIVEEMNTAPPLPADIAESFAVYRRFGLTDEWLTRQIQRYGVSVSASPSQSTGD